MSANFPTQSPPVRAAEQRPPGGLKLGDVYYTLFRHKWKILVFTLAGVLAAAGIWFFAGPLYQSEAKLLVRYVRDARAVDAGLGSQGDVKSPDARGENIINSEIEILTSRDLALDVVDLVGPEKILAKAGGGTNRFVAAGRILRGLEVDVPRRSSVIRVVFNHPDPEMAQTVLRLLVQNYLRKHAEVHRAVGVFDEFLTKQTDALRSQLSQTEQELQKLKLTANVTSVEESKRMLAEQASRVRQELMAAEAELAERRTVLEKVQQAAGIAATTNTPAAATETPLDPVQEQHYRTVLTRLESLRNRELELLLQFTPESQDVRQVRDLIASTEKTKRELETAEPRLLRLAQLALRAGPNASAAGNRTTLGAGMDLGALEAEVAALEARVNKLKEYQAEVRAEVAKINEVEQAISELQRRKQREETKYLYYSASLEQARIDESLGASSLANINVLQEASTPGINFEKTRKLMLGVLFGGLAAGLGLAFLLEMVLDSRLKRPADVEQKLNLPLFLSIPDFTRNGHAKALRQSRVAELPAGDPSAASAGDSAELPVPAPATTNPLRTFHEALRDRLIMYFELKEMHHKPKLVGVTGTHHGAGVSSIAAGLAETLSETGDGNVLLVDMNPEHGPSVYPFYRGKPGCGLSELLEEGAQRESAQVQDNLYVVSLNGRSQGSRVGVVPRRFASLLPKMKASDYDYIIFDMPPVSQTSVTAKVSGLLDMTFLVVESERSNVEQTKRCAALLAESRANVTAVLNRHHNYLPEKLRTDV